MSKWPGIRILKFLEIYKQHECLWNYKCEGYKNKDAKQKAFESIIAELNMPQLTPMDIKLKIKSIRTTYKRELTAVLRAAKQQKSYEPKLFWFNQADSFLRQVSLERKEYAVSGEYEEFDSHMSVVQERQASLYKAEPTEQTMTYEEEKREEAYVSHDEETHFEAKTVPAENVSTPFKTPENILRPNEIVLIHKESPNNSTKSNRQEIVVETSYSQQTIPHNTQPIQTTIPVHVQTPLSHEQYHLKYEEDEYLVFCRGVAAQLRAIQDPYARAAAKFKIQQILFEAETGHYTRESANSFMCSTTSNLGHSS